MIPGTMGEAESAATAKLITAARLRDPALANHCVRTAHIAAAIAQELGLTASEIDIVYLGALLHDVGKLGVPEAVLWKPAGLDHAEWREIRSHPEEGHRLVVDIVTREVSACVLYHHERLDREGYPFGSDLGSLPIAVRIVQAADAYDAMTSNRPYEPPLSVSIALAELQRCIGSQFDPTVVAAMVRLLGDRDGGTVHLDVVTDTPILAEEPAPDPFAVPAWRQTG